MNFDAMTVAAFRRAPAAARGRITFIHKDGRETTADAVGAPAKGADSDGFKAGLEIEEKHRRLSVMADSLGFLPKPGMLAEWGGVRWNVLTVVPVAPNGETVILYRVTIAK